MEFIKRSDGMYAGNLGRVDYISDFEFDLFIRPDTCNPRFRVWFNFTVENVRETQVCAGFRITSPRPPHACLFHLCSSPCVPFIPPPSCLSCDVLQQTVVQRQTGLQRGPLAEHRLIITGVAR
ncbi:hypothetical protein CHARACLAT_005162, partial [Characodon lateralis]|nr:hypothetical protein [Characodon lateralis]